MNLSSSHSINNSSQNKLNSSELNSPSNPELNPTVMTFSPNYKHQFKKLEEIITSKETLQSEYNIFNNETPSIGVVSPLVDIGTPSTDFSIQANSPCFAQITMHSSPKKKIISINPQKIGVSQDGVKIIGKASAKSLFPSALTFAKQSQFVAIDETSFENKVDDPSAGEFPELSFRGPAKAIESVDCQDLTSPNSDRPQLSNRRLPMQQRVVNGRWGSETVDIVCVSESTEQPTENSTRKVPHNLPPFKFGIQRAHEFKYENDYLNIDDVQSADRLILTSKRLGTNRNAQGLNTSRPIITEQNDSIIECPKIDQTLNPRDTLITELQHLESITEGPVPAVEEPVPVSSNPAPQIIEIQQEVDNSDFSLFEARLFVIRAVSLFLFFSLSSLTTLLTIEDISVIGLVTIAACYLFFQIFETAYIVRFAERELWRVQEDIFRAGDGICGLLFLGVILLRFVNVIHISTFVCIPFFLGLGIYTFFSKAPRSTKNLNIIMKLFFSFQCLMISAKLDGSITWDWWITLALVWLYLIIVAIYALAFGIILTLMIISELFRRSLFDNIDRSTQFVGIIWHLFYYGISVNAFVILLGVCLETAKVPGTNYLKMGCIYGAAIYGLMVIYTILAQKKLVKCLKIFNLHENSARVSSAPTNTGPRIMLETEKKESYFVMFSATYFLPLHNQVFARNTERLRRVKETVNATNTKSSRKRNNNRKNKNDGINVQMLRQYKESIDQAFTNVMEKIGSGLKLRPRRFCS